MRTMIQLLFGEGHAPRTPATEKFAATGYIFLAAGDGAVPTVGVLETHEISCLYKW